MRPRAWSAVVSYVGASVRQCRERKGWRQDDLARLARLERAVVARIEQGQNKTLPLREVWAVALALGVRAIDLLPADPPRGPKKGPPPAAA